MLCENFAFVLQVFGRCVLPASFPLARLCARVVSSLAEDATTSSAGDAGSAGSAGSAGDSSKVTAVLAAVLGVLLRGNDDDASAAEAVDSCAAFVPRLFRELRGNAVKPVSDVFLLLLCLRPALFVPTFQPRFLAALAVLQDPATAPALAALAALKGQFPVEVRATVLEAVKTLLRTYNTEQVPDAMLLGKLMEQIACFLSETPWGCPPFFTSREITSEVAALLKEEECCLVVRLTRHIVAKALEKNPMESRSTFFPFHSPAGVSLFASLLTFLSLFKETPVFPDLSAALFAHLQARALSPVSSPSGVQSTTQAETTPAAVTETEATAGDNRVAFLLALVGGSALAACLPGVEEAVHSAVHYETPTYLLEIAMKCLERGDEAVAKALLEKEWEDVSLVLRLLKEEKVRACSSLAEAAKTALARVLSHYSFHLTRRHARTFDEAEQEALTALARTADPLLQDGFTAFITATLQDTLCEADVPPLRRLNRRSRRRHC